MSAQGGKSESSGSSASTGMNQSYIAKGQLDNLNQLWDTASGRIIGQDLGAANNQALGGMLGNLQNNPFQQQMASFANPNNQMAQKQIDLLGQNLNKQFSENLLPQIGDQALQGGGLGGTRQGIAQGLAAQGMQQAFSQGAQGILSNAYNQAQQAAQFGTDWATRNAATGIAGLGQMQQQQYAPLLALAQIIGNPAILQRGSNMSMGSESSSSQNMGGGLW